MSDRRLLETIHKVVDERDRLRAALEQVAYECDREIEKGLPIRYIAAFARAALERPKPK